MDIELLRQLVTTAGVPGREHRVRELIRSRCEELFDEIHVDPLGSLHAVLRPTRSIETSASDSQRTVVNRPPRVMIAAHMDQIGFLVRTIDDSGFLRLNPVGGFDTRNLFARVVTVCPDVRDPSRDMTGVMNAAGKPVHIASAEERKQVPEATQFMVDLGMTAEEVQNRVKVGDMVTINAPLYEVGQTLVSQCMDNRIACFIAIEAARKLRSGSRGHACEVHCVFTVQEEVGLRGAGPAAFAVEPDLGIALDTTLCCDTPGVPTEDRVTRQGQGVGLNVMDAAAIADYDALEEVEALAAQRGIPAQRTILHRGGTDAGTMQRAGRGFRVLTLLTPTRYIHTVAEMVHRSDVLAARDLLTAQLEEL
ncbi:MAG: M42 family metallopeptidase [Phycisphaeraceae bacterium]